MHAHWVVMRVHVVISGSEGYTYKLHQSTPHFSHFFLQSEALTYSQTAVLIKCHGHGLFESNTHQKFWDQKKQKKTRTVFPSQSHALHWNCSKTQNTSSVFQFLSLSPQFIVLGVLHLKPCWLYAPGADSLTSLKILLGFGSSHGRLTKIKPD